MELVSEGEQSFRDFLLVALPADGRPNKKAVGTLRRIDDNKNFEVKYSCYANQQKSVSCGVFCLKCC